MAEESFIASSSSFYCYLKNPAVPVQKHPRHNKSFLYLINTVKLKLLLEI